MTMIPSLRHFDFDACSGAVVSDCATYRYQLHRRWLAGQGWAIFIMLNPSTADASEDDPTIRRCVDFAKRWGNEGVVVGNLYGFRATNPHELRQAIDPVGPLNDEVLMNIFALAREPNSHVVCAWGTKALTECRAATVIDMMMRDGLEPMCLRITKHGHPEHPLYIPGATPLIPFRRAS